MKITGREAISIREACEFAGVTRRTIYNWLSTGKVEHCRTAGGSIRVFVDTLWRDDTAADTNRAQAAASRFGRKTA